MKISGILFALLLSVSMSISAQAVEKGHQKILGVWEFSAPEARQPYEKGILTLKEVDKKLAGEFTVQGQALAIPQIDFLKDILTLGFEIENTPISLKLKLTDGQLQGLAQTPDGPITVTAVPAKKETK